MTTTTSTIPAKYNDIINQLKDYMIDENYIQKVLQHKLLKSSEQKTDITDIFVPIEKDTLFWCYYIIANGDVKYETLNNKNIIIEKQLKIDLISLIRQHKQIIKMYKFDTISNIESNLANDNFLNIKTFLCLCAISNINIVYVSKKTYFESLMNDTSDVYIINEIFSSSKYVKKYGYQMANESKLNNIRNTLYKLDKVDKPLQSISAYKVKELIDICNKLAIETIDKDSGKSKTKKELYEKIVQYF
jgi:hypothetical protein